MGKTVFVRENHIKRPRGQKSCVRRDGAVVSTAHERCTSVKTSVTSVRKTNVGRPRGYAPTALQPPQTPF